MINKKKTIFLSLMFVSVFLLSGCIEQEREGNYTYNHQYSYGYSVTENINLSFDLGDFLDIGDHLFFDAESYPLSIEAVEMHSVFGISFYSFPYFIMDLIGKEDWRNWTGEFKPNSGGWRSSEEFNMRNFAIDFNLTPQDMIHAQERSHGLSIAEIDERIARARIISDFMLSQPIGSVMGSAVEAGYAYIPELGLVYLQELDDRHFWSSRLSLSDINAIFSNDINKLWNAFPGAGILHDDKAHSPEWIFTNIEQAIYSQLIPLDKLHYLVNESFFAGYGTSEASAQLQTAHQTLHNPTPFTLRFQTRPPAGGGNADFMRGGIILPSNPTVTINAWEEILSHLNSNVRDFPNLPTIIQQQALGTHTFEGFYLDSNFTIPLTDTTRMPSRDATSFGF